MNKKLFTLLTIFMVIVLYVSCVKVNTMVSEVPSEVYETFSNDENFDNVEPQDASYYDETISSDIISEIVDEIEALMNEVQDNTAQDIDVIDNVIDESQLVSESEAIENLIEDTVNDIQYVESEIENIEDEIEEFGNEYINNVPVKVEEKINSTEIGYLPEEFRFSEKINPDSVYFTVLALNPDVSDFPIKTKKKPSKVEQKISKESKQEKVEKSPFVLFGETGKSFSFHIMPYGYRGIIPKDKAIEEIKSQYGIGAKLKLRSMLNKVFYAGVETTGVTYMLNRRYNASNYTDVILSGKLGLNMQINEMFAPYFETAVGFDLTCFDTICVAQWITQAELGIGINVNEKWTFDMSLEGSWSWHSKGGDRFYYPASAWMINGYIGGTYKY